MTLLEGACVVGGRAGATRVEVTRQGGRHRTRLRGGLLRAQPLHGPAGRVRIGLLATTALLLGGDEVELDVRVGPGATLELLDVAGTVAYDGRGQPACWRVRVQVAGGGRLCWSGAPFVVADGAAVTRSLEVEAATEAVVLLRETLVLGRTGQRGGLLRTRTRLGRGEYPVLVEDTVLDPDGLRPLPGMLGDLRVVDTVLALGAELPTMSGAAATDPRRPDPPGPGAEAAAPLYRLAGPGGSVRRHLGLELAGSPLHALWAATRAGFG